MKIKKPLKNVKRVVFLQKNDSASNFHKNLLAEQNIIC